MKEPVWVNGHLLCRDCDVFVGYGAIGTVRMPSWTARWLLARCWVCARDYSDYITQRAQQEAT